MLKGTADGQHLKACLEDPHTTVLTADVTLAETSSKLARTGMADNIPAALDRIIGSSNEVVAITRDDAALAGPLLVELRKVDRHASLLDATLLSIARNRSAQLVSCDPAFEGQPDVLCGPRDQRGRKRRPTA